MKKDDGEEKNTLNVSILESPDFPVWQNRLTACHIHLLLHFMQFDDDIIPTNRELI